MLAILHWTFWSVILITQGRPFVPKIAKVAPWHWPLDCKLGSQSKQPWVGFEPATPAFQCRRLNHLTIELVEVKWQIRMGIAVSTVMHQRYNTVDSHYSAPGYNTLPDKMLTFQIPNCTPIHCVHYLCGYSAPAWDTFQDIALTISGPRANKKWVLL